MAKDWSEDFCSNCKVKIPIREEILEIASKIFPNKNEFYEFVPGSGCNECRGIGYKGRTGIHEVLIVNNELRDLMVRGASEHELSEAAKAAGMRTLYEDGIEKVLQGITSVEEVNRVATEL